MIRAASVSLQGLVQGCGVRPAIARAAQSLGLQGWVENTGAGVSVHVQGAPDHLQAFLERLPVCLPAGARVDSLKKTEDADIVRDLNGFAIRFVSQSLQGDEIPDIPADRAICDQCLRELSNPQDRRYRWPFIGCTACGPRYAWLKSFPFLRSNTTFAYCAPCAACNVEYSDAENPRFGMELIACDTCGPQLFYHEAGAPILQGKGVWEHAVEMLRAGGIVALQSFTGFHLLALASKPHAVNGIRQLKARRYKPMAIMVNTMQKADDIVVMNNTERDWLMGEHRPIVLLRKKNARDWQDVAPDNPDLGLMLPQNGLQALILDALGEPVVATSANRRGDPVASGMAELLPLLGKGIHSICYHDVPVWQVQDDSVLRVLPDGLLLLRRARGFAHEILPTAQDASGSTVRGEGAFLKNTVALKRGARVVLSQYLGDSDSVAVAGRKMEVMTRLERLCGFTPEVICLDAHPDLDEKVHETRQLRYVHHHRAHVAALIAEKNMTFPAMLAAWDGIGYGEDGNLWGSEVFHYTENGLRPVFGLRAFSLPGGDRCSREPWRVMAALLIASGIECEDVIEWLQTGDAEFTDTHRLVIDAIAGGNDFIQCTSMGRFLEAIACLLLQSFHNEYEGDIASRLEAFAIEASAIEASAKCYKKDEKNNANGINPLPARFVVDDRGVKRWQWQDMIRDLWHAAKHGISSEMLAQQVLDSVAEWLIITCSTTLTPTLGVSGGCFQNRYLLQRLQARCQEENIVLARPVRLPPNDGAIAYGQVQNI